jgi:hypothetical protein
MQKAIKTIVALMLGSCLLSVTAATAGATRFSCSGSKADAARKISQQNNLKLGMNPKACFGEMKLTPSDRRQIVVAAPSSRCKTGKLLDVYDRSRAGPYYSLFAQPLCGTKISAGPKSPYGDNMITIDKHHYMSKGAHFVRVK